MFNSYHLCLWSFPCNSCQQQVSFSWVYWLVMAPVLCCSYIKLWLISWFWKFCPNLSNTYINILNLSVFNNCESSPGALHFPCLSSPFLFFIFGKILFEPHQRMQSFSFSQQYFSWLVTWVSCVKSLCALLMLIQLLL